MYVFMVHSGALLEIICRGNLFITSALIFIINQANAMMPNFESSLHWRSPALSVASSAAVPPSTSKTPHGPSSECSQRLVRRLLLTLRHVVCPLINTKPFLVLIRLQAGVCLSASSVPTIAEPLSPSELTTSMLKEVYIT